MGPQSAPAIETKKNKCPLHHDDVMRRRTKNASDFSRGYIYYISTSLRPLQYNCTTVPVRMKATSILIYCTSTVVQICTSTKYRLAKSTQIPVGALSRE